MKKENSMLLLTAVMTLSSTVPVMASSITDTTSKNPTFLSNPAEPTFNKVDTSNKLLERKEMLNETINGKGFNNLTLGEKIVLLEDYFVVRKDIHKENQKTILSISDSLKLQSIKEELIQESDNQNKDLKLLSKVIQEIQKIDMTNVSDETKQSLKDKTKELVQSYQDSRSAGRDLNILLTAQNKKFYSNELLMIDRFGSKFESEGDKIQALEFQLKQLKLTDGDKAIYQKVIELLNEQQKNYFFVDNEVVEYTTPFIEQNGKNYIAVSELEKIAGFKLDGNESILTIENGDNVLDINRADLSTQYNGLAIGKNIAIVQDSKMYVPLRATFEMFYYDVKSDAELSTIRIEKQIYEENEVDSLPVDSFVNTIIH